MQYKGYNMRYNADNIGRRFTSNLQNQNNWNQNQSSGINHHGNFGKDSTNQYYQQNGGLKRYNNQSNMNENLKNQQPYKQRVHNAELQQKSQARNYGSQYNNNQGVRVYNEDTLFEKVLSCNNGTSNVDEESVSNESQPQDFDQFSDIKSTISASRFYQFSDTTSTYSNDKTSNKYNQIPCQKQNQHGGLNPGIHNNKHSNIRSNEQKINYSHDPYNQHQQNDNIHHQFQSQGLNQMYNNPQQMQRNQHEKPQVIQKQSCLNQNNPVNKPFGKHQEDEEFKQYQMLKAKFQGKNQNGAQRSQQAPQPQIKKIIKDEDDYGIEIAKKVKNVNVNPAQRKNKKIEENDYGIELIKKDKKAEVNLLNLKDPKGLQKESQHVQDQFLASYRVNKRHSQKDKLEY
eukprot:403356331